MLEYIALNIVNFCVLTPNLQGLHQPFGGTYSLHHLPWDETSCLLNYHSCFVFRWPRLQIQVDDRQIWLRLFMKILQSLKPKSGTTPQITPQALKFYVISILLFIKNPAICKNTILATDIFVKWITNNRTLRIMRQYINPKRCYPLGIPLYKVP